MTLDGRLDEPFWAIADSIDDFRQREPIEGAAATERTVVKVAHDAAALYILVRCEDSNVRAVRASQLRRDADLSSDDNVQLLIDSFHDRRSAFVFATNPNGAMWDAQFSGVEDVNENWNGVWEVAVSRD
ncbi:MAG TPA: carbohydrate binding family 9 domain-containing protein, partial [Gemmatimonadales bacterium]|nr:carbohydrate binding family 9 domain-containing protein [Gemmatimonadales bacterium]